MKSGHTGMMNKARAVWNQFKNTGAAVDNDHLEAVFISGVALGDQSDWQFAWNTYSNLGGRSEWMRWALLSAMAASPSKANRQKLVVSNDAL